MNILNVAYTPFELYYVSSVGYLLTLANPNVKLHLLTRPAVAKKMSPKLAELYTNIITADLLRRPSPQLRDAYKSISWSIKFIQRLRELDFHTDIVCISAFREYFANILCRYLPGNPRLVAVRMSDQDIDQLPPEKRPLLSLYLNMFNRIFGASTLEYRWSADTTFNYAHWFRNNPYDRTIYISDWGHGQEGPEFRLSPPFAALRNYYGVEASSENGHRPTILIAGERTPLFRMDDPSIQALYEHILDFIRTEFKDHRLLFKPREKLTDVKKLKLDGFELLTAELPFEEICLRNQFNKVISVKSTASKVAAFFGHPAYVLYPLFDLPPRLRQILDIYQADMRGVVKVSDLKQLTAPLPSSSQLDVGALRDQYWHAVAAGL